MTGILPRRRSLPPVPRNPAEPASKGHAGHRAPLNSGRVPMTQVRTTAVIGLAAILLASCAGSGDEIAQQSAAPLPPPSPTVAAEDSAIVVTGAVVTGQRLARAERSAAAPAH